MEWKIGNKVLCYFLIALSGSKLKLDFKLFILGAFFGPYHRHLLSLSNESMTSMAYPKSYEFDRFCTLPIQSILHFTVHTLFSIHTFL